MTVDAMSYSLSGPYTSLVSPRIMIGASAGFTLRYVGLPGRFAGRYVRAALIAACTSRAAPSMFRLRSNWIVIPVEPSPLDEVISVTPAMCPNCRSSGVATLDAMISALAPGSPAPTLIVGKSTCGSGDTGSTVNAIAPAIATATVSSVVATGRCTNGAETFTAAPPRAPHRPSVLSAVPCSASMFACLREKRCPSLSKKI